MWGVLDGAGRDDLSIPDMACGATHTFGHQGGIKGRVVLKIGSGEIAIDVSGGQ